MQAFVSITTDRTVIRRLKEKDKAGLTELLCNPSVTNPMAFPDEMKTKEGAARLLEATIASYTAKKPLLSYAIACAATNQFLGVTGCNPLSEKEVEVFCALLPGYWGQGFGTEVLNGLTEYLFSKSSYVTITAPITQSNRASVRIAEKNQFSNYGLVEDPNYREPVFMYKKHKKPAGEH